ncbi:MAG: hypothetical protein JXX28_17155 [Deltaproteobacteria bacterium]|nr:hypothetical protein [Deltaproteobacteria bacterium]
MTTIRNTLLQATRTISGHVSQAKADLAVAEERALTGLKAQRPSDLPEGWYDAHALRAAIADQQSWTDNASRGSSILNTVESTLGSASDLLKVARERAVQGASETLATDERVTMAVEIDALRGQLLTLGNTQINGRYLFAGEAYDQPAFDAAGAYMGTTDVPTVMVGANRFIDNGFDGGEVFQGSVDAFQVLTDLADAMRADDAPGVAALLGDLDTALGQLIEGRQKVGYLTQDNADARAVAESMSVVFEERLNDVIGVDPVQAYSDLANLKTAYESTLQVSAGVLNGASLFNFLR